MTTNINIEEAFKFLQSENAKIRDQKYYDLLAISEENPEKLYHAWDILLEILRKKEVTNKYIAIHLLANIVSVDNKNKFDDIFDEFFQLLSHESPVVSPHIVKAAVKIFRAKPHFRSRIFNLLINIDRINKCRHPELLKSYVIETFDQCYDLFSREEKQKAIEFVRQQTNSESPKTRKMVKEFPFKW